MFLKHEKPEMDDFERKKKFGSKGKIFKKKSSKGKIVKKIFLKMSKILSDTLAKLSQNIFVYS